MSLTLFPTSNICNLASLHGNFPVNMQKARVAVIYKNGDKITYQTTGQFQCWQVSRTVLQNLSVSGF